jgi:hypothetical protein
MPGRRSSCYGRIVAMNSEERIHELSLRVVAAAEGSEEFRAAMDELRTALSASAARPRAKIAAVQSGFPQKDQ